VSEPCFFPSAAAKPPIVLTDPSDFTELDPFA